MDTRLRAGGAPVPGHFLSAGGVPEGQPCDSHGTGRAGGKIFTSFRVLLEEGYLKVAQNQGEKKRPG